MQFISSNPIGGVLDSSNPISGVLDGWNHSEKKRAVVDAMTLLRIQTTTYPSLDPRGIGCTSPTMLFTYLQYIYHRLLIRYITMRINIWCQRAREDNPGGIIVVKYEEVGDIISCLNVFQVWFVCYRKYASTLDSKHDNVSENASCNSISSNIAAESHISVNKDNLQLNIINLSDLLEFKSILNQLSKLVKGKESIGDMIQYHINNVLHYIK